MTHTLTRATCARKRAQVFFCVCLTAAGGDKRLENPVRVCNSDTRLQVPACARHAHAPYPPSLFTCGSLAGARRARSGRLRPPEAAPARGVRAPPVSGLQAETWSVGPVSERLAAETWSVGPVSERLAAGNSSVRPVSAARSRNLIRQTCERLAVET